MKNLFLSALIFSTTFGNFLFSQTALSPGDILFIGFKTSTDDEAGNDCVKLVTLVQLECNTKFIVTDNNWNNSSDTWRCADDEFGLEITCNVPIMAGSVFYIDIDATGGVANCSGGSITKTNVGTSSTFGTNYGLNDSGDNLFVLQGTYASPVFVSALKHSGAYAVADCSTKNNTALPDNLSLATSAIVMASTQDHWHYRCTTTAATKSALKSAILNNANWTFANGMGWDNSSCMFEITDDSEVQKPSGTLAVAGAGCGCLANCNLTPWGSVNCGAGGVAGDCTAGYQNMSTNITVPSGCTYTVSATMRARGSVCTASGADGSCATCDVVKVDVSGGSKSFQSGGSNATLNDSYTLVGPGTIVVSGRANRADEVITYSIGMPCGSSCATVLPIELGEFTVVKDGENAKLEWMTYSERDNDYFTIEKSVDGKNWETLYFTDGQGNSDAPYYYTVIDTSPFGGISYYKLSQTNFNGITTENGIESIDFTKKEIKVLYEYNILGQVISPYETGLIIQVLENGETRKIYR